MNLYVGGLGGTFMFFASCTFLMCIWTLAHIHETSSLTLEKMDSIFNVSNLHEYWNYIKLNFSYSFYFGKLNMYEYTRVSKGVIDSDLNIRKSRDDFDEHVLVINTVNQEGSFL